jgi:hypothetical protein
MTHKPVWRRWWQKLYPAPGRWRPRLLQLEDLLVPATFTDDGAMLGIVLTKAGTNVAVVATSTPSYTLTLNNGDTWSGTDGASVTGNGTARKCRREAEHAGASEAPADERGGHG